MHGKTSNNKRTQLLDDFRQADSCKVLFLSQVGDVAIDLPDANVIIQVAAHFGSRRQEAQRFGRPRAMDPCMW